MKKSLRNYRLFFHRMGLLFLFIPLIVLILSIVLPDRGFSEKENRVLSSLPHLNGNQIASGGFSNVYAIRFYFSHQTVSSGFQGNPQIAKWKLIIFIGFKLFFKSAGRI